jgi:hypothetical protein
MYNSKADEVPSWSSADEALIRYMQKSSNAAMKPRFVKLVLGCLSSEGRIAATEQSAPAHSTADSTYFVVIGHHALTPPYLDW